MGMRPRRYLWVGLIALAIAAVIGTAMAVPYYGGLFGGGSWVPAPSPSSGGVPPGLTPTYVILVHGFNPSTIPAWTVWTYGVNVEAQFIHAGYRVGVVSYYGTFTLTFNNGASYSDPSFVGTLNTPIENISLELGKALKATIGANPATVDFVGHSMGGLVTLYLMEHVNLGKLHIGNVVFLGSPLGGAPITALSAYDNMSGYQAVEMEATSPFLAGLHANVSLAKAQYPGALWLVYAGDANPPWGVQYFNGPNDGLVSVASDTMLGYAHFYTFPDLHIPSLDGYDPGHVSYFEDQSVASELLKNFRGSY